MTIENSDQSTEQGTQPDPADDKATGTGTSPAADDQSKTPDPGAQAAQGENSGSDHSKAAGDSDSDKAPWDGETFDPERAWALVRNLRSDLATAGEKRTELQDELTARDARIAELETEATAAKTELSQLSLARTKETLLAEAGLPITLAGAVAGTDEESARAAVEALSALRSGGGQPPRTDPAQHSDDPEPSKAQQAENLFSSWGLS